MPDIQSANSYIGKVRRLETNYLAEINTARTNYRRAILDIITRGGMTLFILPLVRNELAALERSITAISRNIINQVDEVVLWYMDQQLDSLRKVGEARLPDIQQLNSATYAERQQIYQNTLINTPNWINTLGRNMETNITRLAVADADVNTAVDRLLSIGVADGRVSVFRLSESAVITETADITWTAAVLAASGLFKATQTIAQSEYDKQAIATIDAVTTDCCLQVHGQIQPLDKPFELTGTPRFADHVDNPPFHWHCRTVESLYTVKMEDKGITTPQMVDAAQSELHARVVTGKRETIWPSYSTSRRGGS